MSKPFNKYQGAGKKCPMVHKSKRDYNRRNEKKETQEDIESYKEKDTPLKDNKKSIDSLF